MEDYKKHSLGHRAFTRFFFKKIRPFIVVLIITLAAWYAERWVPFVYVPYADYAVMLLWVVTLLALLLTFLYAYLEYRYYTYTFTDEAFIITYGYMVRNEVAAVYHQIQNVNLRRSVLDRFMGVSEVVILMAGIDREDRRNQISLPAIGKTKARIVQKELLQRARKHFMVNS
ncbi:MAG: PH domain-containing protein [Patescibacteria group bacterium]|nr:PH domain-containing protein [Patescibacteria group bacterium]